MRTIKFRGKRIKGGDWIYGSLVKELYNYYIVELIDQTKEAYTHISVEKETVGQFTGLNDKNGKEIYEGEILYNNDRKEHCIVKYSKEKAMFIVKYLESNDVFTLWESISNLNYSVGNIHENPELRNIY